jgi:hypothetical protein
LDGWNMLKAAMVLSLTCSLVLMASSTTAKQRMAKIGFT